MTLKWRELAFGSLFAGIGGFDLGFERAGMKCEWQVEIDDYATKVLEKHWPDVARFRDIRDCGKHNLAGVDVICGGFPCQDISLAAPTRKGLDGERSSLWFEFQRIISDLKPRWAVVENTPGLYTANNGWAIREIHRALAEMGYNAESGPIPARAFGAPHQRDRVFIVAYSESIRQFQEPFFNKGDTQDFATAFVGRITLPAAVGTIYRHARMLPLPGVCRMDDGFPHRLDRLRCLGNAVVPQVAEWIGRRIMEIENEMV